MNTTEEHLVLMNKSRMARTIRRMAYQIIEKTGEKRVVLLGLNERGYDFATRLGGQLTGPIGHEPKVIQLDRVDAADQTEKRITSESLDGAVLIVVDDVIFTGETMFDVVRHLPLNAADAIYIAVLVDRGNRKYPISPEFTGLEIPTKPREHVDVILNGEDDRVVLFKK